MLEIEQLNWLMNILNLTMIQFIVVFIVDLSGITNTIKSLISKTLTKGKVNSTNFSLPLIGCSLCMTFWCCLIYLFINQSFTIPYIALTCLLAFTTMVTKDILLTLKDKLIRLANGTNKSTN